MRKVSSNSPRLMKWIVAMIAMRRSQSDEDFASLRSGARLLSCSYPPTICAADASTRSQLLMNAVCDR